MYVLNYSDSQGTKKRGEEMALCSFSSKDDEI